MDMLTSLTFFPEARFVFPFFCRDYQPSKVSEHSSNNHIRNILTMTRNVKHCELSFFDGKCCTSDFNCLASALFFFSCVNEVSRPLRFLFCVLFRFLSVLFDCLFIKTTSFQHNLTTNCRFANIFVSNEHNAARSFVLVDLGESLFVDSNFDILYFLLLFDYFGGCSVLNSGVFGLLLLDFLSSLLLLVIIWIAKSSVLFVFLFVIFAIIFFCGSWRSEQF
jgi:hypothetical protein